MNKSQDIYKTIGLYKFNFFFSFLMLIIFNANSTCIELRNIEFQKVDNKKFLATTAGKNIAFVSTYGPIPDKQIVFRFYAEKLCDSGAEAEFQMNGIQNAISTIILFK